jgi:hypothetical protein
MGAKIIYRADYCRVDQPLRGCGKKRKTYPVKTGLKTISRLCDECLDALAKSTKGRSVKS